MRAILSAATAISAVILLTAGGSGAALAEGWFSDVTPDWSGEAPDWSGAHIGIDGGYGWGTSRHTDFTGFNSGNFDLSGGLVGGTLGYDWEFNNHLLIGADGNFSWADIGGSTGGSCGGHPPVCTTSLQAIGLVDGRVGYAIGHFLPYLTGGLAWGQVHGSEGQTAFGGAYGSGSDWRLGWSAGAGVEAMLFPNWSVKLEYRHIDLGQGSVFSDVNVLAPPATQTAVRQNVSFQTDTIRAGIAFHFWVPQAPAPTPAPPPPPPAPTPAAAPAAAPAPAPAPQPRLFIVFFDFDKYNLTPDAVKIVEAAANAYKAGGSAKVTLAGYTDLSGPAGYNMKLSEKRAKTVAAYMAKLGVAENAMDVSWHGKENPRVPTPDGVREPQNRRVEISE